MKITKVDIKDFLGISQLSFDKVGKINAISGGNGVGKSSILKAIESALKSTGISPNIIRTGQDEAKVWIEFDSGMKIERTLTPTANRLKVTDKDGEQVSKPQTVLNELFGEYSFNPVAFFMAKPADRRDLLLSAIDVKITEDAMTEAIGSDFNLSEEFDFDRHALVVIDDAHKFLYEERARINRELKDREGMVAASKAKIPTNFDPSKYEGVDINTMTSKMQTAQQSIYDNDNRGIKIVEMKRSRDSVTSEIESSKRQIAALKERIVCLTNELKETNQKIEKNENVFKSFKAPDMDAIRAEISEFQGIQNIIDCQTNLKELVNDCKVIEKDRDLYSNAIKVLSKDLPRKIMANADMPIEGLEIKGDNIYVGGVAIDTLSSGEKMKFATDIAKMLAVGRELKVILVDGVEQLDSNARTAFVTEAQKDDFEYFITQVTSGKLEVSIEK